MSFATYQSKFVIPYVQKKPSSVAGCTNYILADGSVASVQQDGSLETRPAGTDGPFEQGKDNGTVAVFLSAGAYNVVGTVDASGLPQ